MILNKQINHLEIKNEETCECGETLKNCDCTIKPGRDYIIFISD